MNKQKAVSQYFSDNNEPPQDRISTQEERPSLFFSQPNEGLEQHTTQRQPGFLEKIDNGSYNAKVEMSPKFPAVRWLVETTEEEQQIMAHVLAHVVDWFPDISATTEQRELGSESRLHERLRLAVQKFHDLGEHDKAQMEEMVERQSREIEWCVKESVRKNLIFFKGPEGRKTLHSRLRDDRGEYYNRFHHHAWAAPLSLVQKLIIETCPRPWPDNSGGSSSCSEQPHGVEMAARAPSAGLDDLLWQWIDEMERELKETQISTPDDAVGSEIGDPSRDGQEITDTANQESVPELEAAPVHNPASQDARMIMDLEENTASQELLSTPQEYTKTTQGSTPTTLPQIRAAQKQWPSLSLPATEGVSQPAKIKVGRRRPTRAQKQLPSLSLPATEGVSQPAKIQVGRRRPTRAQKQSASQGTTPGPGLTTNASQVSARPQLNHQGDKSHAYATWQALVPANAVLRSVNHAATVRGNDQRPMRRNRVPKRWLQGQAPLVPDIRFL